MKIELSKDDLDLICNALGIVSMTLVHSAEEAKIRKLDATALMYATKAAKYNILCEYTMSMKSQAEIKENK